MNVRNDPNIRPDLLVVAFMRAKMDTEHFRTRIEHLQGRLTADQRTRCALTALGPKGGQALTPAEVHKVLSPDGMAEGRYGEIAANRSALSKCVSEWIHLTSLSIVNSQPLPYEVEEYGSEALIRDNSSGATENFWMGGI